MSNEGWPTKEQVLADPEFQELQRELGLKLVETSEYETPLSIELTRGIKQEDHRRMMACLKRLFPTDVFYTLPAYPLDPTLPLYKQRMAQLASQDTPRAVSEEPTEAEVNSSTLRIFAGDAWVFYAPDHPNERVKRFSSRGRPPIKQLISNTLLYDQIVIPTQDFLGYGILVDVLGERGVLDLLEADRLRFVRVKDSIAYGPGGRGLIAYTIMNSENRAVRGSGSVEEAISWALGGSNAPARDPLLFSLAQEKTREIDLPMKEIRHETYMDVLNSPYVSDVFSMRNRDMDNLVGINPNQIRVYSGPETLREGDEIEALLCMAAVNRNFDWDSLPDARMPRL